jgi:hypothetical protein
MPNGRCDESTGAVSVSGLKGEALANAYMKAETKAKRRVTLSILGLNMLDESEVESMQSVTIGSHEINQSIQASGLSVAPPPNKLPSPPDKFLELPAELCAVIKKLSPYASKPFRELTDTELEFVIGTVNQTKSRAKDEGNRSYFAALAVDLALEVERRKREAEFFNDEVPHEDI